MRKTFWSVMLMIGLGCVPPPSGDGGGDVPNGGDDPGDVGVSQFIGGGGGALWNPSGAGLEVPAGALAAAEAITIEPFDGALPAGVLPVGQWFAYGPAGLNFQQPVEVTMPYAAGDLPADQGEGQLQLILVDEATGLYETVLVDVDAATETLRGATGHFTIFGAGFLTDLSISARVFNSSDGSEGVTTTVREPFTNLTLRATLGPEVNRAAISFVEFHSDVERINTDFEEPYQHTINVTDADNGQHSFAARVVDLFGNAAFSNDVRVTVSIRGFCDPQADPELELADIPDPDLRDAIIRQLSADNPGMNFAVLSCADLALLQTLDADGIKLDVPLSLDGLQNATNLTTLSLAGNNLRDLGPLADLPLVTLNLRNNQIRDASPLRGMIGLQALNLSENPLRDVSPLVGLENLSGLSLANTQVSALGFLVANGGLDNGDQLVLLSTPLDLRAGSQNLSDIATLENRGVIVQVNEIRFGIVDPVTGRRLQSHTVTAGDGPTVEFEASIPYVEDVVRVNLLREFFEEIGSLDSEPYRFSFPVVQFEEGATLYVAEAITQSGVRLQSDAVVLEVDIEPEPLGEIAGRWCSTTISGESFAGACDWYKLDLDQFGDVVDAVITVNHSNIGLDGCGNGEFRASGRIDDENRLELDLPNLTMPPCPPEAPLVPGTLTLEFDSGIPDQINGRIVYPDWQDSSIVFERE